MGPSRTGLWTLLATSALASGQQPQKPTKRALVVGVSQYQKLGPEHQLRGPLQDARRVGELLAQKFGFTEVRCLLAARDRGKEEPLATVAELRSEMQRFLAVTGKDDVVTFFFAGHGTLTRDQPEGDPDHDEESGYDSALVLTDSTLQENLVRDDELRHWLTALAGRGAAVSALFDACHSGSAMRGAEAVARGLGGPAGTMDPRKPAPRFMPLAENVVALAACRDDESALEDPRGAYGYFSAALVHAMQECDAATTWDALHDRVRAELRETSPRQHPVLRALPTKDHKRRIAFSGAAVAGRVVPGVLDANEDGVRLSVGAIDGVKPASEFAIYAKGSSPQSLLSATPPTPVARVKVTRVNAGDSFATWVTNPAVERARHGVAVCTREPDPELELVLEVRPNVDEKVIVATERLLATEDPPITNLRFWRARSNPASGPSTKPGVPQRMLGTISAMNTSGKSGGATGLVLERVGLEPRALGDGTPEALLGALRKLLHYHAFLALGSPQPNRFAGRVKVLARIDSERRQVPPMLTLEHFERLQDLRDRARDASGLPTLHAWDERSQSRPTKSEHVVVAVENGTGETFYAHLYDLLSDGDVRLLAVGATQDVAVRVLPNTTTVIAQIYVTPDPPGFECLKVLLTKQELSRPGDLTQPGLSATRGTEDALAAMFRRRLAASPTRSGAPPDMPATWCIEEVCWNVVAEK